MKALDRTEVLAAFPPKARRRLRVPDLGAIDWSQREFLAWFEPDGSTGYMVACLDEHPFGFVLHRIPVRTVGARRFMCTLCLALHVQGGVAAFKFVKSHRGGLKTRSIHICADLGCWRYVRGERPDGGAVLPETLSAEEKIARLQRNVDRFARDTLAF